MLVVGMKAMITKGEMSLCLHIFYLTLFFLPKRNCTNVRPNTLMWMESMYLILTHFHRTYIVIFVFMQLLKKKNEKLKTSQKKNVATKLTTQNLIPQYNSRINVGLYDYTSCMCP